MSKQTNYGGKSFVVDRVVELFNSTRSSATINSIKQQISAQQSLKDLDKIREEIENATSDGVISSHEKKGLKREWSSLLSSWLTIRESFENDDNLKSNATFLILKSTIEMLTLIMDKVFENMDTDYIGDDVAKITDLFVSAWDGITRCSQLIQDRLSLSERHRLEVEGDRTIVDSIALKARLYIYANGGYVDVTSSTDYADTDFTWTKPADSEWEAHTGRELSITLADMKSTSPSQFMLTFSHGYKQADSEETIEVNLSVLVSISYGKKIQYAWSDADSVSDLKKDPMLVWNPEPLDNSRNLLYLWRRESSDLSKEDADKVWIYFRETGEKGDKGDPGEAGEAGKDAPLPIVEYQYSNSDRTAPILYKPFKLGGKIMKFKSLLLGDNNSKDWVQNPVKLGKYKWMRISTDGGKTWTYSAVTGPEPSFFELMSSKDTFRQNARGAVDEADEISFWVVRHNISSVDKPAWEVSLSSLSPDASLLHNEQIKVKVPIGFAYGSFSVSVSIGENSETLSKIIYGEKNGEVVARKLGLIDRTADPPQEFPTTLADGISPLADGDYLLVRLADSNQKTYLVPYRYSTRTDPSTGQREGWVPSSSAYSDHSEIMANVLTDVLANSETTPSVSAFYGFFRSLVSNDAFIKFLCTQYLQIQGSIYGGGFDKDGNNKTNKKGFYIGANGDLISSKGTFNEAQVTGNFSCSDEYGNIMHTAKAQKGQSFTFETASRWRFSDFRNTVNAEDNVSVTYNSIGYTTTKYEYHVKLYSGMSDTDEKTSSITYLIPWAGAYNIIYTVYGYDAKLEIRINDVRVLKIENQGYDSSTEIAKQFDLNAGDRLYIYANVGASSPISTDPNGSEYKLSPDYSSIYLMNSSNMAVARFLDSKEYYLKNRLFCNGFDSNNSTLYSNADALLSLGSFDYLYPALTGTKIKFEGEEKVVAYVGKSQDYIEIVFGDGSIERLKFADKSEFATHGWYLISGSIQLMETLRGLLVESIFPNKNTDGTTDGTSIGSSEYPFGAIHALYAKSSTIESNKFIGNVNSEELRGTYKVWGAVAN